MDIGYIRFGTDNAKTRRLNAIAHSYYGMNLVSFGIQDINYEAQTIFGKSFTGSKWVRGEYPIPKIINNQPFRLNVKNKQAYEF